MERLWAQGGMEDITEERGPGCMFCRGVETPADKDAALVVWRPDGAVVLLNKYPYNPGHVMVAPQAHVGNLEDLDAPATADLMRALKRTITVLKNMLKPEGFNIGANIGRVAGAGAPDHVPLHAVPR